MSETHAQDELIMALKPFADVADEYFNDWCPDDTPAWYRSVDGFDAASAVTVGDFRRARSALAALQADPEYLTGWKLVPVKITLEMQKAYFDVIDKNMPRIEKDARFGRFDSNREAYQAMLAASPPPEYLSGQEAVNNGWRKTDDTPDAGGTYLVGGYVSGPPRMFLRCWATLIITVTGPEWSYVDPDRDSHVPMSYWTAIPPHPEFIAAIATPDLKAGKAEVRNEALREAATTLLRQLNTMQENEKRNGSLLYHEQSPMGDTIRALATALNPGAPK